MTESTTIKKQTLLYLNKYAEKDLAAMISMFADDIVLRDWKIRVEGKDKALSETQKNFQNAKSIDIDVLHTHVSGYTVAAELKIIVDHTEELYVVDIITFNNSLQIQSIRAYLGRGDD